MTKRFNTIDGETLITMPLKPIKFIIENLLAEGLHILAGSPKVGKSWLALWLSVAVAKGEEVWGNKVKKGDTLYLCFEDSQIRIQNRLFDITDEATDTVNFCTENAMLGGELEERIVTFIAEHPDVVLIIKNHSGISGTQSDNRDEFQRMISDATKGLIDIIITKSISRFARNTIDTLKYVRQLKDENVAIIFEKENINTLTMNGEMLLTILSSLAQQESESLSANTKMGLKMKMKRGEIVGNQRCLGYDYDKESKMLYINEEEAKIVRYIFNRYTSGTGCFVIAQELTAMGAVTKKGNTQWMDTSVRGIINNEKYKGDLLMGKTFTVDPISKRRLDNFGEEEKYYIKDHHEPIISREQFDKAQEILSKRSKNFNQGRQSKYSLKYTFSSMMKCGYCSGSITRKRWHSGTDKQKDVWFCVTASRKGKKSCTECKAVEETIIENAFVKAFNILCTDNKTVVEEFLKNVEEGLQTRDNKKRINKINAEINSTEIKISKLLDLHLEDKLDKITYEEKYGQLSKTVKELKSERAELDTVQGEEKAIKDRLTDFKKILKMPNH